MTFARNPIYAILHEACYADGGATRWSAERVQPEEDVETFLHRLQRNSFAYFVQEANLQNGLILDKTATDCSSAQASICGVASPRIAVGATPSSQSPRWRT